MHNNCLIRKATKEDVKDLAHIKRLSWKESYSDILDPVILERATDLIQTTTMFTNTLSNTNAIVYVFILERRIIGYGVLKEYQTESMEMAGELEAIYFLPSHWRKGYGRMLMTDLLIESMRRKHRKIILWVFERNLSARCFYESFQFKETGEVKTIYQQSVVCYQMDFDIKL